MSANKLPKIGIIGIGGVGSIGHTLSTFLALKNDVLGATEGVLLNNKDDQKEYVESHARSFVFPILYYDGAEGLFEKVKFGEQKRIADECALTYICIESAFGKKSGWIPAWQKNFRKNLYAYNYDAICGIAEKFQGAKGQCVVVTNPCLNMAKLFQEKSGMKPGQVVAFNPDHERLILLLKQIAFDIPELKAHIDDVVLAGDHGSIGQLFASPEFYSLCKKHITLDAIISEVMSEGLDIVLTHGNVGDNIVPQMVNYIRSSINQDGKQFVSGIYHNGVFCSLPFVNRDLRKSESEMPLYRAVPDDWVKCVEESLEFKNLNILLEQDQNRMQQREPVEEGVVIASFPGSAELEVQGYNLPVKKIFCEQGEVQRFRVNGTSVATISSRYNNKKIVKELCYWESLTETPVVFGLPRENTTVSLAVDGKQCYVGSVRGNTGNISVYDFAGQPSKGSSCRKQRNYDFSPVALREAQDVLYCADHAGNIREISKSTLDDKVIIPGAVKGSLPVNDVLFANAGNLSVLCAKTRTNNDRNSSDYGTSDVYLWDCSSLPRLVSCIKVNGGCFDIAPDGERIAYFLAVGNQLKAGFIGGGVRSANLDFEVKNLKFDPGGNCVYACGDTNMMICPFDSRSGKFIERHFKPSPFASNLPVHELQVGKYVRKV
jgi:WD40 repeat protein